MRTTVYQDISQPPSFVLGDGEVLANVRIVCVGSRTGRFLFTEWSPCIEAHGKNITITGCECYGGGISMELRG